MNEELEKIFDIVYNDLLVNILYSVYWQKIIWNTTKWESLLPELVDKLNISKKENSFSASWFFYILSNEIEKEWIKYKLHNKVIVEVNWNLSNTQIQIQLLWIDNNQEWSHDYELKVIKKINLNIEKYNTKNVKKDIDSFMWDLKKMRILI